MTEVGNLSMKDTIILGSIASTIEAYLQHPLSIIKNSYQYNVPIRYTPSYLYKGVFIGANCGITMTMMQYGTYSGFYSFFNKYFNNTTSSSVSSLTSGVVSSIIVSPFELSIILKCKYPKQSLCDTINYNIKQNGYKSIFRGITNTGIRDSLYVFGFLTLTPYLEKRINIGHKSINSMAASTISGIFSSVISHPFDTLKTIQQFNMYNNINYKEHMNFKKLYSGCFYRTLRNCTCFFIFNESNKFFINYLP